MTADREPQTRDYLRANLFDGSEDGTLTAKISSWLDELTEVVDVLLAEARADSARENETLRAEKRLLIDRLALRTREAQPDNWWRLEARTAYAITREAQPDPRVEALETLLRDLRFGLDRLGYGEEVARIDAALAAPAPPSEAEARLRDAAAVSYSFADRQTAPPPTADPEP